MGEIISVSNSTRVHEYRGTQIIREDLIVEAGCETSLYGYASNGVPQPSTTICRHFTAFLGGYPNFTNSNCTRLEAIPLGSSCKVSIKVLGCDYKELNLKGVQSATITFDSAFQKQMEVNLTSNRLEYIILKNDELMLAKGKVYDMIIKVVDELGNQSIIMKHKVRFN